MSSDTEENEIFMGKVATLSEKRATLQRLTFDSTKSKVSKQETSFKIIQTQSEPNLAKATEKELKNKCVKSETIEPMKSVLQPSSASSCSSFYDSLDYKDNDDSFLLLEHKITAEIEAELENTHKEHETRICHKSLLLSKPLVKMIPQSPVTPIKSQHPKNHQTKLLFKTPGKPVSAAKKSPAKDCFGACTPRHKNVCSPVAYYIKNSPQPTLIQNVKPKKPLPGLSLIPKLSTEATKKGKENIELPRKAYIKAKETKMVEVVSKRLPTSKQVSKIATSLSQPQIIRHEKREIQNVTPHKRPNQSFGNITLSQADVSVCTVESTHFK